MQSKVLIFCPERLDDPDLSIAKLITFLGIEYEYIHLNTFHDDHWLPEGTPKNILCGVISCRALGDIDQKGFIDRFKSFLMERISYLLIYGVCPGTTENRALNSFTDGKIESVSSFENNNYDYKISGDFREICKHFSGISFGPINNKVDFRVIYREGVREIDSLISVNEEPLFSKMKIGNCTVFLLASGKILDLQKKVFLVASNKVLDIENKTLEKADIQNYFSQIVPVMMFLKYVFKNSCWHNDTDQACLIIDDPLLKDNYGFLNYIELLKAMDRYNFSTTIAFIPWNYERTSPRVAKLFRENPNRFSLCVHGCNHSKSEFELTDYSELNRAVKLADKRMEYHQNTTGLPFDRVMVFPQGRFSTKAMKILKSNNYLAAVNYEIMPTDFSDPLPLSCLLEPAITSVESFPLFPRRSPENVVNFVFDLFCGKPALIVAHHDFFREGYDKVGRLMQKISALNENIQWKKLGDIIERSYLQRYEGNNTIRVRIYSSRAIIENTSDTVMEYLVTKDEAGDVPIERVTVNGREISYEANGQLINVSIEVEPKQKARLQITYRDNYCLERNGIGQAGGIKIFIRRHLSEIRDNYISKSKPVFSVLNRLRMRKIVQGWINRS